MKNNTFTQDIINGLKSSPKRLPTYYLYDEKGSELFEQITRLEEYYLTRTEMSILDEIDLSSYCSSDNLDIIELGAGNGIKARPLIKNLLKKNLSINYFPIDVSQKAHDQLLNEYKKENIEINIETQLAGFSDTHNLELWKRPTQKLLLFLGSTIGNFEKKEGEHFIKTTLKNLSKNDLFLLGCDLKKDIRTLNRAYNDSEGVTKKFNLNYLDRIIRETKAQLDPKAFDHYGYYDVVEGSMKSYLISLKDHKITFSDQTISLKAFEPIFIERSHKFDNEEIEHLAQVSSFKVLKNFQDNKRFFTNSLWTSDNE